MKLLYYICNIKSQVNNIIKIIFDPYVVIKKEKLTFFLWFLFVLVLGQLGTLSYIILSFIKEDKNILLSILSLGNLYVFSIALLGRSIHDTLVQYLNNQEVTSFKKYQIGSLAIAIIIICLLSLLYATTNHKPAQTSPTEIEVILQVIFYIISISLAIYIFSVRHLDNHINDFYHLSDNNQVIELQHNSDRSNLTDGGIEI